MSDAVGGFDPRADGEGVLQRLSDFFYDLRDGAARVLIGIALFPADEAARRGPTSSASALAFSRLAASLAGFYTFGLRQIRAEQASRQWQQKAREEVLLHRDIVRRLVALPPHRLS